MSNIGISMARPVNTTLTRAGRQHCHVCPRKRDREFANKCSTCRLPCCPDHHKIICDTCLG